MSITLINPEGLPQIGAYHHVAVASGSKLIFLAGQVSWDADGRTVGAGDLAAQVERCYLNVAASLSAAGATFEHVVKLTAYIVDWTPDKIEPFLDGVARAGQALGHTPTSPATLLGVAALDIPEHLVEVEAIAVLD
ncbi:RidA family protein [Deinococcus sp. HMF7620]|uniref:RidA family protein n=1 Tax=Deinococcus arboris TaxID=2682977 RepID=A0A7C9IDD2_9DEIO|nr:RidA family protein [Deinococcus arboris]MVN88246.1 RidA family protein [Deinococcus arboris]